MKKPFRCSNVQYALLSKSLRPRRRALLVITKYVAIASLLALFSVSTLHLYNVQSGQRSEPATLNAKPGEASMGLVRGPKIAIPTIPSTFKTVGLIFYGRRSRVEILDCYLKVRTSELGRLMHPAMLN